MFGYFWLFQAHLYNENWDHIAEYKDKKRIQLGSKGSIYNGEAKNDEAEEDIDCSK